MSEIQNNELIVGEIHGTIIRHDRETLLSIEEMLIDLMKTERVYSNNDILKGVRLAWLEVHGLLYDEWLW